MIGLSTVIPDPLERARHIYHEMLFGIALTEVTALLARRTLYGCKEADHPRFSFVPFDNSSGNIKYPPAMHVWVNGKCVHCNASASTLDVSADRETHAYPYLHNPIFSIFSSGSEALTEMQFDVIMGNPPYQLDDGGFGKSATPLYHKFVEAAKSMEPKYLTFVIPARWYAGGRGLEEFRQEMLTDRRISHLVDFPDARDLFAGVDVAGGCCYFLWQRDYDGDCLVMPNGDRSRAVIRSLNKHKVFIRSHADAAIVEKVNAAMQAERLEPLSRQVSSTNPFGLRAHHVPADTATSPTRSSSVLLMTRDGDRFVNQSLIKRNKAELNRWKVVTSRLTTEHAGSPDSEGKKQVLTSKTRVLPPNSACTETYIVLDTFSREIDADRFLAYVKTKFFRYLMSQLVITQDITRKCFDFVPRMANDKKWTDEKLYSHFDLTDAERTRIESAIKPFPVVR